MGNSVSIYGTPVGRKAFDFFESKIREAMSCTPSNIQAAKYLKVSLHTYKKYAEMYIDKETGKNLYQLHKATPKGIKKKVRIEVRTKLEKVLNGEVEPPKSDRYIQNFIKMLIKTLTIEEKCCKCGWNDRRPVDLRVPLLLNFIDGNPRNFRRENIELICPNCYSIYVGDVTHSRGFRTEYMRKYSMMAKEKRDKEKEEKKLEEVKKVEIDYDTLDLDKPMTPEEIASLDLSKI